MPKADKGSPEKTTDPEQAEEHSLRKFRPASWSGRSKRKKSKSFDDPNQIQSEPKEPDVMPKADKGSPEKPTDPEQAEEHSLRKFRPASWSGRSKRKKSKSFEDPNQIQSEPMGVDLMAKTDEGNSNSIQSSQQGPTEESSKPSLLRIASWSSRSKRRKEKSLQDPDQTATESKEVMQPKKRKSKTKKKTEELRSDKPKQEAAKINTPPESAGSDGTKGKKQSSSEREDSMANKAKKKVKKKDDKTTSSVKPTEKKVKEKETEPKEPAKKSKKKKKVEGQEGKDSESLKKKKKSSQAKVGEKKTPKAGKSRLKKGALNI